MITDISAGLEYRTLFLDAIASHASSSRSEVLASSYCRISELQEYRMFYDNMLPRCLLTRPRSLESALIWRTGWGRTVQACLPHDVFPALYVHSVMSTVRWQTLSRLKGNACSKHIGHHSHVL